jgi:hypothetical protein
MNFPPYHRSLYTQKESTSTLREELVETDIIFLLLHGIERRIEADIP